MMIFVHFFIFSHFDLNNNFLSIKLVFIEFETTNVSDYQFASFDGEIEFKVRASENAYIILSSGLSAISPVAEICVGYNNQQSLLYHNETEYNKIEIVTNTPNILSAEKYNSFWIRFKNNIILFGREMERDPLLAWQSETDAIRYIGFHTGPGKGSWILDVLGGSSCWVPGNSGNIPDEAIAGGEEGDRSVLYIARVRNNTAFLIGKYSTLFNVAYAASDGKEVHFEKYELLVGKTHKWVMFDNQMKENELLQATNAGQSGDGTVFYVARMIAHGRYTPGMFDVIIKRI